MALPFTVVLRSGRPVHDQLVFAVTKAIVTGQLRPGDPFPSVRTVSQELHVNPNTAQKVVTTLVERGLLETRPGVGAFVAPWRPAANPRRRALIASHIERLVIDAKHMGLTLDDVLEAVRREWRSG
jgi:GntR family transcriptional regulator